MMRRWGVGGLILGLITATALSVSGQGGPAPAQIQAAFRSAGLSGTGIYTDAQVPTWDSASNMFLPGNGGGGGGAPSDATYLTQTANGSLSAEQAVGLLNSGIMRVATATGVVTSLTDSAGIAANISDETGSGSLVFGTTPTITTPVLSGTITGTYTIGGTPTLPLISSTNYPATTSAQLAGVISDEISAGAAPKLLFGDQALASTSSPTFNVLTVTSCTGCGSGGANTALSNLASVAINTALLPSGAAIDLGSGSSPFRTGYLNTDLVMTGTTATIRANTADASDNSTVIVAAGGANGALRGASLQMYGNEHAQAGDAVLQIGGGTGGQFTVNGASAWLDIAGSSGATTLAGATSFSTTVSVTGHTTFEGVTSTGATGTGKLVYDTAPAFTTSISTPAIITASGALGITPTAGSNLNVSLSTTGDFAVNTSQLYVDTSANRVGINTTTPGGQFEIRAPTGTQALLQYTNGVLKVSIDEFGELTSSAPVFFSGLSAGSAGDEDVCKDPTTGLITDANASTCIVSSLRFKSNWQPLNVGLAEVLRLTPGSFYYTNDTKKVERIGLNAENMAVVEPRLAFYEQDGPDKGKPRGVAYEESVALLTKAIQQLTECVKSPDPRACVIALETR